MEQTVETPIEEAPSADTLKQVATHTPRGIFIVQEGEGGPIFRIETPEAYAARKNIIQGRSTSLKKLARISRVRKRGYVKRLATNADVTRYGPAIVMGAKEEAA